MGLKTFSEGDAILISSSSVPRVIEVFPTENKAFVEITQEDAYEWVALSREAAETGRDATPVGGWVGDFWSGLYGAESWTADLNEDLRVVGSYTLRRTRTFKGFGMIDLSTTTTTA